MINWKRNRIQFQDCNCELIGPSQGKAGTSRQLAASRNRQVEAKRLRVKPNHNNPIERSKTIAPKLAWLTEEMKRRPSTEEEIRATLEIENDDEIRYLAATSHEVPERYKEFRSVFEQPETPELPNHGSHDHQIPIQEGKEVTCKRIYPMSEKESRTLREYIDEQLQKGTIRPSKSPAGHGVLFVPKKTGELRLCVDYRPLNTVTIKDRHPLPLIGEIQDRIRGAKWFTKLDIRDAYHQIRIAEGEEWKTAFRTKYGHYEYTVMPFGLTNAPASFQRYINEVLGELLDTFVIAYLDDILIFSENKTQHEDHVKRVLRKLQQAQLRAKLSKCEFHVQETDFLGHWISTEGIQTDKNKVQAIRDWPTPTNVKELQQFTGLINYYRRFIDGYAKTMTPLFELLKKSEDFTWETRQQEAFEEVKKRITDAPILVQHDPRKETTIETDASDYAIGMRMTQQGDDGKTRPVAFHSRKLVQAELNYDIHDKEMLAIVTAFKVWRVYLEGAQQTIIVKTDHKNLTYFTTTKELTRRQARWAETLSQYDFRIIHCKGNENGQADALSRRPDYEIKGKSIEPAILRREKDGSIAYNRQQLAATIELETNEIEQKIAEETKNEPLMEKYAETVKEKVNRGANGTIYIHGLLYVPEKLREDIIRQHHDDPTRGHPGIDKTMEQILRNYYFPNMRRRIMRYIQNCDTCIRNKPARHLPYGQMQTPEPPKKPWEWITIDFITKLPKSEGSDMITVITDRLTKYVHLVPSTEKMDSVGMAYMFLKEVITNHGMPRYITSDRDKLFTSRFWKSLTELMGIDHRLTTAYHPQTNGQTERANQTIEQYLRHYVNYQQDDWTLYLPLAQFAYNNAVHTTTAETPFFANYGYHPSITGEPRIQTATSEEANQLMTDLGQLHTQMTRDIEFTSHRMAFYYDKHHGEGPDLKKGEKVFLLSRNIRTKRPSKKLDHQKIGPFIIERKTGPVNYKLRLPESMRKIHPVFHVSLLEPAPKNAKIPTNVEIEESTDEEYEVERVCRVKRVNGKPLYLVKWKGYPTSENTWEPIENLRGCQDQVQEFHLREHRRRPRRMANSIFDSESDSL